MSHPQPSVVGSTLSHYRIVSLLGSGGMGTVFKAEDTRTNRFVAIKLLRFEAADRTVALERLRREAFVASNLHHPNICAVYDISTAGDQPFLVMECLQGQTLRTALTGEPMPERRVIEIGLGIVDALIAAHARGIVHRDLKPANVFLTASDGVKVLDFGVAKLESPANGADTLTDTGAAVGTVAYMSPEQMRGEPVDARSDLFAVGLLLYEMATGRPAFRGQTAGLVADAILNRQPEAPSRVVAGISSGLEQVILKALEKDRRRRHSTAAELRDDLERVHGCTRRRWHRPNRFMWRRASASLAVAAATLAAVASWSKGWPDPAERRRADRAEAVVAVLPFTTDPAEPSNADAAQRLSDDIRAGLSKLSSVRLLSQEATDRYGDADIKKVGTDLSSSYAVESRVRVEGNSLQFTIRLVDTQTGNSRWTTTYKRLRGEVPGIGGEITLRMAEAMNVPVTPDERHRILAIPTRNSAAYDLYVSTQHLPQSEREQNAEAVARLTRALQLDPKFALAQARMAYYLLWRSLYDGRPYLQQSVGISRAAIQLDPTVGYSHAVLATALYLEGAATEARAEFLKALQLDPNARLALTNLSELESQVLGRRDEGLYWARRAARLAPDDPNVYYHVGEPLIFLRDDATSERWLQEGERRYPDIPRIQMLLAMLQFLRGDGAGAVDRARRMTAAQPNRQESTILLAELAYLTDAPDALTLVEPYARSAPDLSGRWMLKPETFRTIYAHLLCRRGQCRRAQPLLDESLRAAKQALQENNEWARIPVEIAAIYAIRGERDLAFEWLDRGRRAGYHDYETFSRDPVFSSLRGDARFEAVRRTMEAEIRDMRVRSVDLRELATALGSAAVVEQSPNHNGGQHAGTETKKARENGPF